MHFDRPRRNRKHPAIRSLVRETRLWKASLIQPLFVWEGGECLAVGSMPGIKKLSVKGLVQECGDLVQLGCLAVAIFPSVAWERKDARGSCSLDSDNILFTAVQAVKKSFPGLMVIADVALDPYTDHGHDGIVDSKGHVDNDASVEALCKLAVAEAGIGVDIVAPSDMMDGRVGAIRGALDNAGFQEVSILSYAVKYASAYYNPFRDAVGSGGNLSLLDKKSYQMDPANVREAIREALLDVQEGADMLMVKPAGPYLDIIRVVREQTLLPLAAYQTSGEYAQIHAAAQLGWLNYKQTRDEALLAIRRAGADLILTYFAREIAETSSS
ncbi:porphobilinogen synthase [Candidatus Xiphinematobacter sp. Idaho Grape]|uniref:porphobilinogen synthase n=1 Tax=Candidatus Xiphinematobacter sp. Idaho Grape TaxID=1704307 RepID=UPI0007802D58|nr:porphobilinogen synthase [Candidatus Xiphinematobacter sp. Idaho Grape]